MIGLPRFQIGESVVVCPTNESYLVSNGWCTCGCWVTESHPKHPKNA
jgi:hypothetical protein